MKYKQSFLQALEHIEKLRMENDKLLFDRNELIFIKTSMEKHLKQRQESKVAVSCEVIDDLFIKPLRDFIKTL